MNLIGQNLWSEGNLLVDHYENGAQVQNIFNNEIVQYVIHKITAHYRDDVDLIVAYGSQ